MRHTFVVLVLASLPCAAQSYSAVCLTASSVLDREWDKTRTGSSIATALVQYAGSAQTIKVAPAYRSCFDEVGPDGFFELAARNLHPANWGHVDQALSRIVKRNRGVAVHSLNRWNSGARLGAMAELLGAARDGWAANTLRSAYNADAEMLFSWVAERLGPAVNGPVSISQRQRRATAPMMR